jgi:histidine ammonia-lyase
VVCPTDNGFKDYIRNVMATITSYHPDCIMVDDDFRTIWYKGEGCACPEHMARFNRLAGTSLTREELWEIVHTRTEEAKRLTDAFIEVQKESLLETARVMRSYLEGSEMIERTDKDVQDPYSFRCVPQVHGASKDAIAYVESVFMTEVNSATDNPTILPDEDLVVSAGNFHGQPLSITLDFLALALAELGSISERRTYQLISGKRGLPSFLVAHSGLNSGFMIPQYAQASIVSQNKQLCTPCVVDTIDSSQGQEDHVSMGANAATKCVRVVENVEKILGIEIMNGAQAFEFRRPLKSSAVLEEFYAEYRRVVPFIAEDQVMYTHMAASKDFIVNYNI